jgi:hypothetical protein
VVAGSAVGWPGDRVPRVLGQLRPPLSRDGRLCRCLRRWQPCTGPGRSGASWTRAPAGPLCPVTGRFGWLWLELATPAAARAPDPRLQCGGLPPAPRVGRIRPAVCAPCA